MMNDDIGNILNSWRYSDFDVNVRIIPGADGRPKLQMRLDLGLLQMEIDGRPDGRRPKSFDTYLEFYENKVKEHQTQDDESRPFLLSAVDCYRLQQEAIQFYHRYVALMKLKDYPRVVRDTMRNIQTLRFVEKYSDNDEIIWQFLQHYPYISMMKVRASASIALNEGDYDQALVMIQEAIEDIEKFRQVHADNREDDPESEFLKYWYDEIEEQKPLSEREKLQKDLDSAIENEDYELAAILRDRIAELA